MTRALAPFVAFLLVSAMLALALQGGLAIGSRQGEILDRTRIWIDRAEDESLGHVMRRLFDSAVAYGYVIYDPEIDAIRILTRRELADNGPSSAQDPPDAPSGKVRDLLNPDTTRALLWRGAGAGAEIRAETERQLDQRALVAVRDAGLTQRCKLGPDRSIDPDICNSTWRTVIGDAETSLIPSEFLPVGRLPNADTFRRLARVRKPLFGEWHMLMGSDVANQTFSLVPDSLAASHTSNILVDLIGQEPEITPNHLREQISIDRYCIDWPDIPTRMRVVKCPAPDENMSAEKDPDQVKTKPVAIAYRLTIPAGLNTAELKLNVKAAQVPILPPDVRERIKGWNAAPKHSNYQGKRGPEKSPEAIFDDTVDLPVEIKIDDRFSLSCDAKTCKPVLAGRSVTRLLADDLIAQEALRRRFAILQADRDAQAGKLPPLVASSSQPENGNTDAPEIPLPTTNDPFLALDPEGRVSLSDLAVALNLQPMLGVPGLDNGSYLDLLENLPADLPLETLQITFDPDIQKTALSGMQAMLEQRRFPVPRMLDHVPADRADKRRAAFVVMDINQTPGAVKAAVSYPFLDPDVSTWDLVALNNGAEGNSPATPTPWRGLDSRLLPGSAMKVASALSLIRSAIGENRGIPADLRPLLEKSVFGATPQTYERDMDFSISEASTTLTPDPSLRAKPFSFGDRGSIPANVPPSVIESCKPNGLAALQASDGDYGICEALALSSNIFFGRMAVLENRELVKALYDPKIADRPYTGLGQTLAALGLSGPVDLVLMKPEIRLQTSVGPKIEPPLVKSAPGLASNSGPGASRDFHERDIAQNAFGQQVQATPLTMATIAGSVATNRLLTPHIAAQSGTTARFGAEVIARNKPLGIAMLGELRRGMRAVMRPGGTGFSAFGQVSQAARDLRPRIHAKTGTANIETDNSEELVHWLMGWVSAPDGTPTHAFACSISHVSGSGPCAALSGLILGNLAREGKL